VKRLRIGDLVRLAPGSSPERWAADELVPRGAVWIVMEDPKADKTDLFYVLHPPSGERLPVTLREVQLVAPYVSR
jgi:hypothetical protein